MDWSRGHIIGHGSSASVSTAVSNLSGDIFAVKSAELSQSDLLQKEVNIISTLNSPHIVAYKGCETTTENNKLMFNMKMEYVSGGTIGEVIRKQGDHSMLQEPIIANYTNQIIQGLEYLHSTGIVHCDIKPDNILLAENGDLKIADFGCSKRLNICDDLVIGGTPMFMAPEVVLGEEQSFPADIWALGCTILEMATGCSPWSYLMTTAISPAYVLYKIALSGESPNFPDFLSDKAKDFLDKCLTSDPRQRWTAKQLLEHPFIQEFDTMNVKESQGFDLTSPTSILDHAIWNSGEESEMSSSDHDVSDSIFQACLENSLGQRIMNLSLNSGKAEWAWGENWVTIRGGGRGESGGKMLIGNS